VKPEGLRTSQRPLGRLATRWLGMLDGLEDRIKGRVLRGKTLARAGRVWEMELAPGTALAEVQDAEVQRPTVRVRTFDEDEWTKVLAALRGRLSLLAKLIEGEVADELLAELDSHGVPLVPRADEIDGDCDCGDWAVPCTHGAALHHVLAEALDGEPFLLFTLRGRTREQLLAELRKSWGDTATRPPPEDRKARKAAPEEAEGDPFTSPEAPPPLAFRFGASTGAPAVLELGPLAGDDDLHRALQPLYDAGAAAALAIALAERPGEGPRRRRGRSTVPVVSRQAAPRLPPPPAARRKGAAAPDDLTEQIVDVLAGRENGATTREVSLALGVNAARVQEELDEIANLGLVYRTGRGAMVRWFLG
jgi:uncharacterized Zn finger protein